jgi:hypothetical protein
MHFWREKDFAEIMSSTARPGAAQLASFAVGGHHVLGFAAIVFSAQTWTDCEQMPFRFAARSGLLAGWVFLGSLPVGAIGRVRAVG